MKIIASKHFPPRPFAAIMLCGVLIHRQGLRLRDADVQHEAIHARQQREMLWVGFFVWYLAEWLVRWPMCRFSLMRAYRNISMEREAYACMHRKGYLQRRRPWAWIRFLRQQR